MEEEEGEEEEEQKPAKGLKRGRRSLKAPDTREMFRCSIKTHFFSVLDPDPYLWDPDSMGSLDPCPDPDLQSGSGCKRAKMA